MKASWCLAALCVGTASAAQVPVPTEPPAKSADFRFHDARFGVGFAVPPGWTFTRRDRQVSTFRLDAQTASPKTVMRGVAAMDFNPFPLSTLSGALVYFSVEKRSGEAACVEQAPAVAGQPREVQEIGGMSFVHGHEEHGRVCVEDRDEIYTAYRKGKCYRFDLEMHTFCAQGSGAKELTAEQMDAVRGRMAGILSTVRLDWEKGGGRPVTLPPVEVAPAGKPEDGRRPLGGVVGSGGF